MAQKVNPISLRLGLNRRQDSSWFADFNYTTILHKEFYIQSYVRHFLNNGKRKGFRFKGLTCFREILQILPMKIKVFPFFSNLNFSKRLKNRKRFSGKVPRSFQRPQIQGKGSVLLRYEIREKIGFSVGQSSFK